MSNRYDSIQVMMKQLQKTFNDLLQDKISFEATMNAIRETAKENTCPDCGHQLKVTYEIGADHRTRRTDYCDYCGSLFTQ